MAIFRIVELCDAQAIQRYSREVAELLTSEWPSTSTYTRMQRYAADARLYGESIILIVVLDNERICGHVRIQKVAMGTAALLTSLLVASSWRGQSLGTKLMNAAEHASKSRFGVPYLYLSTHTAVEFYRKLGYHRTDALGSTSKLSQVQQQSIERVIAKRIGGGEKWIVKVHDHNTIWFRKRLIEANSSVWLEKEQYLKQVNKISSDQTSRALFHRVKYQRQVGPSCGLALLRMLRDSAQHIACYRRSYDDEHSIMHWTKMSDKRLKYLNSVDVNNQSLIQLAIDKDMTIDGEILNCEDLAALARTWAAIDASVEDIPSSQHLVDLLDKHSLLCIAYDRGSDNGPLIDQGQNPHWALVHGYIAQRIDAEDWKNECILAILQHGMSKVPLITQWKQLCESNMTLCHQIHKNGQHYPSVKLSGRVVVMHARR